ncbi:MAG TPA: GNAT family N-acetyltransferase, partial [Deinococcales bacterium]|nr:GNAT family N-acetyltransferase [Deinococcales bacterium]
EASGLRIASMAELAGEEGWARLHELLGDAMRDEPNVAEQQEPGLDDFKREVVGNPYFPPEQTLVALDGERWAATTGLMLKGNPEDAYTWQTAVRREYRGRGLARALKVLSIERARAAGVTRMSTNNDSRNAPMLRVNDSLGYARRPGFWRLRRSLQPAEPR